jgi:hypothetical protein
MDSKQNYKEQKLLWILKIRKSNTKNSLWQSDEGKKFIIAARAQVKKSKVVDEKEFFTVYEIVD